MREDGLVVPIDGRGDDGSGVVVERRFEEQIDVAAACGKGERAFLTERRLDDGKAVQCAQLEQKMSAVTLRIAHFHLDRATSGAPVARRKIAGIERDALEQVGVENAS